GVSAAPPRAAPGPAARPPGGSGPGHLGGRLPGVRRPPRFVAGDLFLHLIDHPLERPQGQLLDVGIVPRILTDRLISRLERTKLLAGHLEFALVLQLHEITSIIPLGLRRRSVAKMLPTSSSQPSCLTRWISR